VPSMLLSIVEMMELDEASGLGRWKVWGWSHVTFVARAVAHSSLPDNDYLQYLGLTWWIHFDVFVFTRINMIQLHIWGRLMKDILVLDSL